MINYATCRCDAQIFERSVQQDQWQWAHVDPYDRARMELCPDGLTAVPLSGTQTNPRRALAARRNDG